MRQHLQAKRLHTYVAQKEQMLLSTYETLCGGVSYTKMFGFQNVVQSIQFCEFRIKSTTESERISMLSKAGYLLRSQYTVKQTVMKKGERQSE